MANRKAEARYLPMLAILLVLLIGTAGYWLFSSALNKESGAVSGSDLESLLKSQAVNLQVKSALAGDKEAMSTLTQMNKTMQSFPVDKLGAEQKDRFESVRSSLAVLVRSQKELETLHAAGVRLQDQVPKFTAAIDKLELDLADEFQPALVAQLRRLRLLGQALRNHVEMLSAGVGDTQLLNQRLLDAQTEMQDVMEAIESADSAYGLSPIPGLTTKQAISSLARRTNQISARSRDALAASSAIATASQAAKQINTAVNEMEADQGFSADSRSFAAMDGEFIRPFAMLAMAGIVLIIMGLIYYRASGYRKATAVLAEQTEQDQTAILQLLDELGTLADGDLTVQVTVSEDITGAIADSINFAVEALRELVTTIDQTAVQVDSAAKQTAANANVLEKARKAQSRQIKAASESISQMGGSIDEVSGDAERSSDVARHSVDVAHKGGDAVRRTIEGMNTIRETIQETSKRIKRLGESSQEIGDIVELINDIADQTNILSLNASIQASMAGEAGRGFAVVADEVQRLAERSAKATKQIEVLVRTIQSDTNEAVVSMERSTTDVVGGALLAENAGAALEEIEQVSNQIAMLVQNISGSAMEQAESARAAMTNMSKLEEISSQTDKSAGTTAESISKLSALATQLRESVAGFQLPQSDGGSGGGNLPEPKASDELNTASAVFADQKTA
ncbi:MAG: methyl-accepting chemotaxis protein [Gammaproteobacteria bacterium]